MRILLYNNSHLPRTGGKEIVVHQLALAFRARGHEVALAGPGGWWRYRDFETSYPVFRWPQIPGVTKEFAWQRLYAWAKHRFPCDVVHAHTTYPTGYTAAKADRGHDCPIIITPHGADIHKIPEIGFGHRLDPDTDRKIRWALQHVDYATAISESIATALQDAGMNPERIVPIPNGVDVERYRQKPDFDVFDYLGFPEDTQLVLSVGNYHRRKGHELLIESLARAAAAQPRLRLAIVGATSEKLIQRVKQQGLEDRVVFTGSLPYPVPGDQRADVLAALLRASTLYVSSSVAEGSEGLSLALLESMAAGVCTIASNVSGNKDIIVDGVNGVLVESGCTLSLTNALVRFSKDRSERERLACQGRRTVDDYSWTAVAGRYLDLFETAIEARRAAAVKAS